MKRILTLILVIALALTALVGCDTVNKILGKDTEDNHVDETPNETPDEIPDDNQPGGEQPDDNKPSGELGVDAAIKYVHLLYKDLKKETKRDFDLVGKVPVDGVDYYVIWTSNNDKVAIKESSKSGMWTVDIPDSNEAEFTYTLTATITDADGNVREKSYDFVVPVIVDAGTTNTPVEGTAYKLSMWQNNLSQTFYALGTTQDGGNKFINTTTDPKEGIDFYVEVVDGGYKIYTEIDGTKTYVYAHTTTADDGKVSKYVGYSTENSSVFFYVAETNSWQTEINGTKYTFGTYNNYKTICISEATYITAENTGVSQFVVEFVTSAFAETLEPEIPDVQAPEANSTLTIPEAIEVGKNFPAYTDGKYYVTGKITSIYNEQYGNMYIADENGNELCIYGTYDATGANRFDAMTTKPAVGDTITVYGVLGAYNGASQMKNGWITAINGENLGGNGGNETPETNLGIVDTPEVGVAYKFGLFHGNENATVYFNGENYNGYAWYLAYATSGVDVYLETVEGVEGGYRLYFMNGEAKTYIVAFPRDGDTTKGTLKLDTVVPTEYYTFNAEYNTLIYTSTTGEQFYLGSSGTYKSISLSAISYITSSTSYIAHLYAEGANGGEAPHEHNFVNGKCACGETDPNYVAPEMPEDGIYTIPQALAAAEGTTVIVSGTVESFYYAWDDSYGNCSVYIVDADGNKLLAFRLATKVELGDKITVTGTIAVYNGTNQIGAGCTATIDSTTGDDNGNTPADPSQMTIPEVLASAAGTNVIVSGTVSEIYQAWSDQYSNISFYISDENGNRLLVFRTGTLVSIGDQVTVTGTTTLYNEVIQIAQGGVTVVDVAHVCSEFTEATCLAKAQCVVCDKETGETGDHSYVDGTCSVCGHVEGEAEAQTITAYKSVADLITEYGWTSSTTKQEFTLDSVVSVKINGGANTGKAYNGDHIRIYATDSPAGTITINLAEGYELVSIKVTTATGTYAFLCVDGSSTDISNTVVAVSGSSVLLNSVKNGSDGKQVRVTAIEVVYKAA